MAWSNAQKGIIKAYQRYAGMSDPDYRDLLHTYAAATSSRDAHLTQFHFDAIMPLVETRAHLAETNGRAVGRRPRKIADWYYWRHRYRRPGQASHAQLHRITTDLWPMLCDTLPEPRRSHAYLCGIASHAVGHEVSHLHDLSPSEAGYLIDALKDRLAHALRRGPANAGLSGGTPSAEAAGYA